MSDTQFRPRRSVLYMPSSNERALQKARSIPCDGIIFDLEDAVAPDAKPAAREAACAAVQSGEYGRRELIIRVNGMDTQWHLDDMKAACAAGPDAIAVPKVSMAQQVLDLAEELETYGAPAKTTLWAMVETPIAMLHAFEIASASPKLSVLVMGTNDLVKDMRARHTPMRLPMVTALGLGMLAARAHGLTILDGVYNDIQDAEGFRAVCQQGLEMGFDGKTLIHPSQVEPCNEVFAPSAAELEMAGKIVTAFKAAQADGKGVVTVDGRMIENLHVEQAERALALATAIKELQAA